MLLYMSENGFIKNHMKKIAMGIQVAATSLFSMSIGLVSNKSCNDSESTSVIRGNQTTSGNYTMLNSTSIAPIDVDKTIVEYLTSKFKSASTDESVVIGVCATSLGLCVLSFIATHYLDGLKTTEIAEKTENIESLSREIETLSQGALTARQVFAPMGTPSEMTINFDDIRSSAVPSRNQSGVSNSTNFPTPYDLTRNRPDMV